MDTTLLLTLAKPIVLVAAPAVLLAFVMVIKYGRALQFWLAALPIAVAAALLQWLIVMRPWIITGMHGGAALLDPMMGWHLLVVAIVAVLLWMMERTSRRPWVLGLSAGLFLSIGAVMILSLAAWKVLSFVLTRQSY